MSAAICTSCGSPVDSSTFFCRTCGQKILGKAPQVPQVQPPAIQQAVPQQAAVQQPYQQQYQQQYQQPYQPQYQQPYQQPYQYMAAPVYSKSKITAGLLALLIGGLGVHKFYLDQIGLGFVYLLFCWTGIPGIIALVEGILYLCATDEEFDRKYVKHY